MNGTSIFTARVALIVSRLTLLLTLAVVIWMVDGAGDMTVEIQRAELGVDNLPDKLQSALGGCHKVGVAAEVTGELDEFALLLPTPADRSEMDYALRRDFVFIGAYTLSFLGLAGLLWHRRDGRFARRGRPLAWLAVALTLVTAGSDVMENYYTFQVLGAFPAENDEDQLPSSSALDYLSGEDRAAAQKNVEAKRGWSYAKWITNGALCMVLASVFLVPGLRLATAAGGILWAGGCTAILASIIDLLRKNPWEPRNWFGPWLVEAAFGVIMLGIILGMLWLLHNDPEKKPNITWHEWWLEIREVFFIRRLEKAE